MHTIRRFLIILQLIRESLLASNWCGRLVVIKPSDYHSIILASVAHCKQQLSVSLPSLLDD